jgi:hypothetical protein
MSGLAGGPAVSVSVILGCAFGLRPHSWKKGCVVTETVITSHNMLLFLVHE